MRTAVPQTRTRAQSLSLVLNQKVLSSTPPHPPALKKSCLTLLMDKSFPDVVITAMGRESFLLRDPIICTFML